MRKFYSMLRSQIVVIGLLTCRIAITQVQPTDLRQQRENLAAERFSSLESWIRAQEAVQSKAESSSAYEHARWQGYLQIAFEQKKAHLIRQGASSEALKDLVFSYRLLAREIPRRVLRGENLKSFLSQMGLFWPISEPFLEDIVLFQYEKHQRALALLETLPRKPLTRSQSSLDCYSFSDESDDEESL